MIDEERSDCASCPFEPIDERPEVDAIVRKARAAGIDCAQWQAGCAETIFATAVDGAATQGFLLVSPAGRKKRISSILTKGGIADAWSGDPESRCFAYPGPISTASWRTTWRSASRKGNRRRPACSRLPRRSAAPTGNLRA
jgi:hypothetical protein